MLVMESGVSMVSRIMVNALRGWQMKKGLKEMMEWIMRYMGKEGDLADNWSKGLNEGAYLVCSIFN